MTTKIVVKKSKPNFITIALGFILCYYGYTYLDKGNMIFGVIAVALGITSIVHNLLLLTTPLLIHQDEYLIVKPKIPFEKKTLQIDEIKELKVDSESQMFLVMKDKSNIKLDLGGFKKHEIGEIRTYLLGLIK